MTDELERDLEQGVPWRVAWLRWAQRVDARQTARDSAMERFMRIIGTVIVVVGMLVLAAAAADGVLINRTGDQADALRRQNATLQRLVRLNEAATRKAQADANATARQAQAQCRRTIRFLKPLATFFKHARDPVTGRRAFSPAFIHAYLGSAPKTCGKPKTAAKPSAAAPRPSPTPVR